MALLIKVRPIVGPTLRSLFTIYPRTFSSRSYIFSYSQLSSSTTHQHQIGSKQTDWQFSRLLIRHSSSGKVAEAASDGPSSTEEPRAVYTPTIRSLDRAIANFEDRSQRNERVHEKDFVKLFDLFTRVIKALGNNVTKFDQDASSNIIIYTNILLRSCGKLMIETQPKVRELLAGNLWTFIKETSVPVDISHYNSLLRVMNENETVFDPKKLLQEIETLNLSPDRITYQRLIHQYCLQGDINNATSILETMKNLDMELSQQIFASLIIGYSKQESCPSIDEIFDLMRSNSVEPNNISYCAAFLSIAAKSETDPSAIEKLEHLIDLYHKDEIQFTINDKADLIVNLSKLQSKSESIKKFLDSITVTLSGSVATRFRYLTALVRAGELERASEVYWTQKVSNRSIGTGNLGIFWIQVLAANHNVPAEFAINQCQLLIDQGHNQKALHQLFYNAAENGRLDLVRKVIKSLVENDGFKIQYTWPLIAQAKDEKQVVDYLKNDLNPKMDPTDLIDTFSMWVIPKFADNIERLFELNKEFRYDSNVLMASFLNYAVQENKFEEALKFISNAPAEIVSDTNRDQQNADEDPESDIRATPRGNKTSGRGDLIAKLLNQIADQTKDAELVKKTFNMCQVSGQDTSPRSLAALIRVHILNNNYDAAIEEFIRINLEYRVAPCRAELMRHCLETKNPEKLQKVMNCVTEIYGEQNSLFDLAVCCLKIGKLKQAQKIFVSPGFRVRPVRVYQVCRSLARAGHVNVLEDFVSLTRDMYDVDQEYLYQVLIETYERTSNAKRALHLWNIMQEEEFQPSKKSLVMIANVLEKNNINVPFQKPSSMFRDLGRKSFERREREL